MAALLLQTVQYRARLTAFACDLGLLTEALAAVSAWGVDCPNSWRHHGRSSCDHAVWDVPNAKPNRSHHCHFIAAR